MFLAIGPMFYITLVTYEMSHIHPYMRTSSCGSFFIVFPIVRYNVREMFKEMELEEALRLAVI